MRVRILVCSALFLLFAIHQQDAAARGSDDEKQNAAEPPPSAAIDDARPPPAVCSAQPWTMEAHDCGDPRFIHGRRVRCEELGLKSGGDNITLEQFDIDATGFMSEAFALKKGGFTTKVYTNTNHPRAQLNHWGITTMAQPDGSTMTVDAIILTGRREDQGSLVFRFDQPEFNVRNMAEAFVATKVQLCGYRRGMAGGPPPP
jgi:hypothetical protein